MLEPEVTEVALPRVPRSGAAVVGPVAVLAVARDRRLWLFFGGAGPGNLVLALGLWLLQVTTR